ncbi:MAG: class I SAM-dependent methyltransferase [Actinomycetota bacterium]|nr:class I SAM-dependent methyltransferase [Actinomycetota bacterium]
MATREAMPFGPIVVTFDETVLRPRPWTLAQSEWAAELAAGAEPLLEIGCGAGHIGLAAAALSGSRLVQVDRDPAACRWAAVNAADNGCDDLAQQRLGAAGDALADGERFPVVIADPPYVPSAEVHLYPEDPLAAIDGGPDGLDGVCDFLAAVEDHLEVRGSVILQVRGIAQVEQLRAWLAQLASPALKVAEARSYGETRALVRLMHRSSAPVEPLRSA